MIRKPSNVLNTGKVLERIAVMEQNKLMIKDIEQRIKPARLQDIADEFSKELGFKISKQAIAYIKRTYYDQQRTPKARRI